MVDEVRANAEVAEKVVADRETEAADAALKSSQKMLLLAVLEKTKEKGPKPDKYIKNKKKNCHRKQKQERNVLPQKTKTKKCPATENKPQKKCPATENKKQ